MKQFFTLFITLILIFSCSENSTDPIIEPIVETGDAQSFISANVKTDGTQYFTFGDSLGSFEMPEIWDMAFSTVPLVVETSPCQYFTMPNDPVILTGTNVTMATVEAASLDDVTEIPKPGEFFADATESVPHIGQNWFNAQYACTEDVYAIKTCGGDYALMQIVEYQYNPSNHTLYNIKWRYKYNSDGSADFAFTALDSFVAADASEEMKYFSFKNGAVSAGETCEIKLDGSYFWLGENVTAKKLSTTDINSITTITDENFVGDTMPNYITLGWYDYGESHLLTAKDYVYVVKANNGKHAAFEIVNYYNSEGESGTFTINWKYLD